MMAIAGTSAMKGLAMMAITPTPTMGLRHPLTRQARLAPAIVSAKNRTLVVGLGRAGVRTNENTTSTKTKDAALMAKQSPTEPNANAIAAKTGPITRPRLNCADESDTAART